MRFMALIYGDESAWESMAETERSAVLDRYLAFAARGTETGSVVDGAELDSTGTATTVRVRDGETVVTDGPFAEVKEALGGYFLLECETIGDACRLAAEIPAASHGAIEVRPVHEEDQER